MTNIYQQLYNHTITDRYLIARFEFTSKLFLLVRWLIVNEYRQVNPQTYHSYTDIFLARCASSLILIDLLTELIILLGGISPRLR